jgi:hypothetical protein
VCGFLNLRGEEFEEAGYVEAPHPPMRESCGRALPNVPLPPFLSRTLGLTTPMVVPFLFLWKSKRLGSAKPRLEGAHAMRRWLSRRHEIHAPVRLSQAA